MSPTVKSDNGKMYVQGIPSYPTNIHDRVMLYGSAFATIIRFVNKNTHTGHRWSVSIKYILYVLSTLATNAE